jgi:5-methylcytosine-specific restriction endonuclease McrA
MCRNSSFCTELGTNPDNWSIHCPLPTPAHFDDYLNYFILAVEAAIEGNLISSLNLLEKTNSDELRDWFVEHGQMSGWHHRLKILKVDKPDVFKGQLEKEAHISKIEKSVYLRDQYVCQYCGIRVIDPKVLKKIEKLFGIENFKSTGKSNNSRHGISLTFRATADHVLPISYGGRTNLENLVTCCWNCNYGKYNVLLEQMGIHDPRLIIKKSERPWMGLVDKF